VTGGEANPFTTCMDRLDELNAIDEDATPA